MQYLFLAGTALFLLIVLFTIVLLCGGNCATDRLTRPVRACIAAHHFNVSPQYARQALELMDKLERGDISEQEVARRGIQFTEYYPDGWKGGKHMLTLLILW